MRARRALPTAILAAAVLAPAAVAQVPAGTTLLVSRPSGDALPSGGVAWAAGRDHAVSADGRYVVFSSDSDALLPPGVHSTWPQVFRLDRQTGTLTWISHTPGGQPGNETSAGASISGDGTKVAYYTQADNIVAGDTNGYADILVWNAATDTSTIASRQTSGALSNGFNTGGVISRDGTKVVWQSEATNLSGADTSSARSVYRRDLSANITTLVSRADGLSGTSASESAYSVSPSADGDLVAFVTATDGLDPSAVDSGGRADVFIRRVSTGDTWLVSRQESGAVDPPSANGQAGGASLSDDGSVLVFDSTSTDIVAGDTGGHRDVFRRAGPATGALGITTLVSTTASGSAPANGDAEDAEVSGNGGAVAYWTSASDAVPGDTNGMPDVVMRNGTGVHLLSRRPDGAPAGATQPGNDVSLDNAGTYAVFAGVLPTISDQDDDAFAHVYGAEPLTTAPVAELSRPPGLTGPFIGGLASSGVATDATSRNGRYVAFTSMSGGFPGATLAGQQAYVRDVKAGTLELVSRTPAGAAANGPVGNVALSADGRYAAYTSGATNLDPADTSSASSVFVFDRVTGTTRLVSRAPGADGASANDESGVAGISADGMRVAFVSSATNLGAGADAPSDAYVRDLTTDQTILASRADGTGGADADQAVGVAAISGDGHVVAFSTSSTNLGTGGPAANVWLRNIDSGTTTLGARADGAAGAPPNESAGSPALDGNGDVLAFTTAATNFGVTPSVYPRLWVRDVAAGTTRLASRGEGAGGAASTGVALGPSLSEDGSRVAFTDTDGSLTGEAPANEAETYVRDLAAEHLQLVSRADGGGGAPGISTNAAIGSAGMSDDGRCVAFSTAAPGLAPVDYGVRDFVQVYLRAVDAPCAGDPDLPRGTPPAAGGTPPATVADRVAPVVSSFRATRRTFAVSAKRTAVAAATKRRRTPRGTTLSWKLSEAATVRIAVAKQLSGRRKGKRCVKPTRKLRKARHCVRLAKATTLTRRAAAGTTKLAFSGRIGRKALARGRYTLTLVATDAAGNRSKAKTLVIRIVKP